MSHPMRRAIIPTALCGAGLIGLALDSFVSEPPAPVAEDQAAGVVFVDRPAAEAPSPVMQSIRTGRLPDDPVVLDETDRSPWTDPIDEAPLAMAPGEFSKIPRVPSRATELPQRISPAVRITPRRPPAANTQLELDLIVASIEQSLQHESAPKLATARSKSTIAKWNPLDDTVSASATDGRDPWKPANANSTTAARAESTHDEPPADSSASHTLLFDFDATADSVSVTRHRALALLITAREDLAAGRFDEARQKALEAQALEASYSMLDDRPDLVLHAVDRLARAGTSEEAPAPQREDWMTPAAERSADDSETSAANPFLFQDDMELELVAPSQEDPDPNAIQDFMPFEDGEPDLHEVSTPTQAALSSTAIPGSGLNPPASESPVATTAAPKELEHFVSVPDAPASRAANPRPQRPSHRRGWQSLDDSDDAEAPQQESGRPLQLRQWQNADLVAEAIARAADKQSHATDAHRNDEDSGHTPQPPHEFDAFIAQHSPALTQNPSVADNPHAANPLSPERPPAAGQNQSPAATPLFEDLVQRAATETSPTQPPTGENPFLDNAFAPSHASSTASDVATRVDNPFSENPFADEPVPETPIAENPFAENPFADDPLPDGAATPVDRVEHAAVVAGDSAPHQGVRATGLSRDAEFRWPVLELAQSRRMADGDDKSVVISMTVRNVSSAPAYGVVIENFLPPGSLVTGVIPRCNLNEDCLRWDVGTLQPGEDRHVWLRMLESKTRTHARLALARYSANPGTASFADIHVDVHAQRLIREGDPLAMHFRLWNGGSHDLENVLIRDVLPPELHHPGGHDISNEIPALPAGRAVEMDLQLTAAQAGQAINRVTLITGDGQYITGAMELSVVPAN